MDVTDNRQQRAVIYLRVASARQEDQTAIARQGDGCLRIANRHGLTVIREYADIGRPARLEQQIELLRLLDDLHQQRDVAAVIVWDYARLARSMAQLDQVIHHVRACGAEIVTITGVEAGERYVQENRSGSLSVVEEATTALGHVIGELWHRERSERAKRVWEKRRKSAKQIRDEGEEN